jgi:hypothetical protein
MSRPLHTSSRITHTSQSIALAGPGPTHILTGQTGRANLIQLPSESESGVRKSIRPFELVLFETRVYARVKNDECGLSDITNPSTSKSGAWSMLSGLSLDQISQISVIALPISLDDVVNSSWYRLNLVPGVDSKTCRIAMIGNSFVGKSTLITTVSVNDSLRGYDVTLMSLSTVLPRTFSTQN